MTSDDSTLDRFSFFAYDIPVVGFCPLLSSQFVPTRSVRTLTAASAATTTFVLPLHI